MSVSDQHSKRLAKNTLFLYFRMMLTMAVQLYTVRVVLNALGATDYGLYNVVGGIVTMFSFLSNTMANASQRYFSFEIGRNNFVKLKQTFSITLMIYCILGLLIFILAETIGLWFLNHRMVVPKDRLNAANWVYQFSLFTFMATMFQIPYDAIIIAHEKMDVYAYVSILEVVLKLLIVFSLNALNYDKLKLYAILIFLVTLFITSVYKYYCVKKYQETKFKWFWEKEMFSEIVSYSGWNLFGEMAGIGSNQGVNIILNLFFGPIVNASRGIAFQINASINGFVKNFMTATRPQIIKYYAQGENEKMESLVFQSSKFSFFLLFIISIPIIFRTDYILTLWLKELPIYISFFVRLIVFTTLVDTLSYSLVTASQATGRIKMYQIVVGCCLFLNVPLSYLFLKLGFTAKSVFFVAFFVSIGCLFLRLYMLKRMLNYSIMRFFNSVIFKILFVLFFSYLPLYFLNSTMPNGMLGFICFCFLGGFLGILSIYFLGLTKSEQAFIKSYKRKLVKQN